MGYYVYRVTAQRVKCSDGKEANVAVYAYKPYWDDDKANNKMDFRSGCPASRKLARDGKLTDRIVQAFGDKREISPDAPVYGNPCNWGTFTDDNNLGTPRMPRLEGVKVVA